MRIQSLSASYKVNSRYDSSVNAKSDLTSAIKLRKDIVRVKSKKQKEKVKLFLSRVVAYFNRFEKKGVYRFKLNGLDNKKPMVFKSTDEESYFSQVNEGKRAVKALVELGVNSDSFLRAEGIFRLSPSKTEELKSTTNQIIENFDQYDNHLVASRIKNELGNSLTTTERASIEKLANKCSVNSNYIPTDSELPAPLLDVIKLSRAIYANSEINKMSAHNLATVLAPCIINGEKPLCVAEYLSKLSPLTVMISRCIEREFTRL